MNTRRQSPTHHSLMHPEKRFMLYRICVIWSAIRQIIRHSEAACMHSRSRTHPYTPANLFQLRHLPSQEGHNPGGQTGKRRSRSPGDSERAPRWDARSEHVHRRRRVHAGEDGAGGDEQTLFSADDLRCSDALPITDASADILTPFSQSHRLRLPDRTDRHINSQRVTQKMESPLYVLQSAFQN